MRILHVVPSVSSRDGGPARAVALMERALTTVGVAVTTLTTDDATADSPFGADARPFRIDGARRIAVHRWTDTYKVAPGLVTYLLRNVRAFDVVHIHAVFSFASTTAAWIARGAGIPYIVRPLGTLGDYGITQRRRRLKQLSLALIEGPMLRHAAAVQFTSRMEMDEVLRLGLACRGVVVPLGIEAEPEIAAQPRSLAVDHPELAGRRVILFLSRLDPKKNVEALLDAFAASDDLQRTSTLVIAGGGRPDYVAALHARARALSIGDRVLWLGHVEGARKAAALAAADIFVLPSFSENFGIAAVEAMLAGVPPILTPGVAIAREAAAAGGAVVAGTDAPALTRAMLDLIGDESRRSAIGARARQFALDTWSSAAMAERLVALYRDAAASKGKRVA